MTFSNDPDGRRLAGQARYDVERRVRAHPARAGASRGEALAMEAATTNAKRLGLKRREFLVSACGAATALLGMNAAYARAGRTGGWFDVPRSPRSRPKSPARRWRATSSSSTCRDTS
jgi:uncharacterized protein